MNLRVRRPSGALIASIGIHILFGAALVSLLKLPYPLGSLFDGPRREAIPVERIGFLSIPRSDSAVAGQSGDDGRPTRRVPAPPPPPLTAPVETPTGIPDPAPASPQPQSGSGPVVGRGGFAPGITPSFSDPRVWTPLGPLIGAPKTHAQRLDSLLVAAIRRHQDSLAALAPGGRAPGDWTVERNGKKYGIDQQKIYIGDVSIPTAVLALLPLNVQGNPSQLEQQRTL
ncbi:MAG: hypothetical protein ABR543_13560, partial [Gemmatimonadaceae bacterium]